MGTRAEWVHDFLTAGGYPTTDDNVRALLAWCRSEFGGSSPNPAAFNLFATTQVAPGSTPYNSAGVQNYPDWSAGVHANLSTLAQDHPGYDAIRSHLVSGQDASATCAAISASVWGSHPNDAILAEVASDPAHNADLEVGERPGAPLPPDPIQLPTTGDDDVLNDADKALLGQWIQDAQANILRTLIGDGHAADVNVLGQWMQEQSANVVQLVDAKLSATETPPPAPAPAPPA